MRVYGRPRKSIYVEGYADAVDLLRLGHSWRSARVRQQVRRFWKKAARRSAKASIKEQHEGWVIDITQYTV